MRFLNQICQEFERRLSTLSSECLVIHLLCLFTNVTTRDNCNIKGKNSSKAVVTVTAADIEGMANEGLLDE